MTFNKCAQSFQLCYNLYINMMIVGDKMTYKILILEDENTIREMLMAYLTNAGFEVRGYADGISALADFDQFKPHLAILDVMMKGINGFDVLSEIRGKSEIPVLMLTARTMEDDRIKGFELGADDYIRKPFSPKEVVSRVNVFLRRIYGNQTTTITYRELVLDTEKKALYKNDQALDITTREYSILWVFFNNIGIPLTREQIINKAIGYDYEGYDRSIDAFIKNIRHKIEDDVKNPEYIKTKYGYGYTFGDDQN